MASTVEAIVAAAVPARLCAAVSTHIRRLYASRLQPGVPLRYTYGDISVEKFGGQTEEV